MKTRILNTVEMILLLSVLLISCSESDPKIILTPRPGPEPRINGTRIFGVRPGSPFLFTLAATGERPMKYEVLNLPEGLVCDAGTGKISGVIIVPGEYITTMKVTNSSGTSERQFRIVCGDNLALTPHMGWNSWYVWENNITDSIMRASAEAMVSSGMIDHGYMYINIDDCWAVKQNSNDPSLLGEPYDQNWMINSNGRFPDMRSLTDYIHSLGLKAGIYTSPGPTTCAGHTGAYQHEEKTIQRFTEWGFDFLKYDWCSYGKVAINDSLSELKKPYSIISDILKKQDRDIILNLCQYGMGDVWKWGKSVGGHSWRTAGDLGGSFEGIGTALFRDGFDVFTDNELQKYGGPGGWNDPDYILIGLLSNWKGSIVPSPLTPNEQYTQISLWSLQAAPLIFSGDITRLDDFTLSLLTNDEVIDVDQDPLGRPGWRVTKINGLEVWKRPLEDRSIAVGLFNRGEKETTITALWSDLGIKGRQKVRDLWRQKDLGNFNEKFNAKVGRHGVVMIRLWPEE
jgi:alpha-galactosidase